MRKIYSLVLMTAMLLVGTNTWAKDFTSASGSDLQDRIDSIMNGDESDPVIKLTQPVSLNSPIWIGTQDLDGPDSPYKSITLDLNGQDITMSTGGNNTNYFNMFVLTHGELKVINSSAIEAQLHLIGKGHEYNDVFFVTGSYRSSGWNADGTDVTGTRINTRTSGYFTHLEIGERVVLKIEDQGTGININNCLKKTGCNGFTFASGGFSDINYTTELTGTNGFLYGARVDLKGQIIINGTESCQDSTAPNSKAKGKIYGIKINGTVQSPASTSIKNADWSSNTINYLKNYKSKMGEIAGGDPTHMLDTTDAPFIHIYPQASITTGPKGKKSAPVYASGYAKWLIEGTCKGKTGIYVSSGVVALNNANVSSNAEVYTEANGGGGAEAAGSGVVVNSRGGSYSGDINVTISGDTKIEGTTGYAVAEYVNTSKDTVRNPETGQLDTVQNTKVQSIVINGGTFEGGDKGAIIVSAVTSEAAQQSDSTKVVIYGGNVDGKTQVGTSGDIDDITPSGYHNTEVTNADGTTTVVISKGSDPTPKTTWAQVAAVSDKDNPKAVKWEEVNVPATIGDGTTNTTLYFGEMQIISGKKGVGGDADTLQELTISNKATLYVNRLILNDYARITIEAGGKLIVTGDQGINAPVPANIVLKSTATKKATFIISDKVNSNKQPNATVEFTTTARQLGAASSTRQWQRFASPMTVTSAPGKVGPADASYYWTAGVLQTFVDYFDGATGTWKNVTAWDQIRAFGACAITNNVKPEYTGDVTYSFTGQLMGNVTDSIRLKETRWNYFGNSYMAPMGTRALLAKIITQPGVDGTIYLWDMEHQSYLTVNQGSFLIADITNQPTYGFDSIPAMGFLIVKNPGNSAAQLDIDYKNSIYNYTVLGSPVSAPARAMSNLTALRIDMQSENGVMDQVYLLESNDYSADYDNSFDAEKYMNDNMSIYVAEEDMNYSMFASDNILGAMISLQTKEDINYTLTFSNVHGEVYALRDNLTNAVVLMNEGATYNFTAQPNATLDGRFQIVSRQEMPTAVETVEEIVNAPKAVYTIMGQYVGETTDWNNLPAGVYVVDGVKIVK